MTGVGGQKTEERRRTENLEFGKGKAEIFDFRFGIAAVGNECGGSKNRVQGKSKIL